MIGLLLDIEVELRPLSRRGNGCFLHPYPRIHDLTTLAFRYRETQVQVELADFGDCYGEVGDAQQNILNRLQSDG